MLIADTSKPEALGSKLLRAAKKTDNVIGNIQIEYNSPDILYSPSMKTLPGRIYYKLRGKRTIEWNLFSMELRKKIRVLKPEHIIVTNIIPLGNKCFDEIEKQNTTIVNYLIDDPWNPIHINNKFLSEVKRYDHIYSTQKERIGKLIEHGAKGSSWLPCAYDPDLHYQPLEKEKWDGKEDIVFIGTGAKERYKWLSTLSEEDQLKKEIYGNNWENYRIKGWNHNKEVQAIKYCKKIYNAKVTIGLLREGNKDKSTDRSYEIGAIGGCGLYQDTEEHRQLLYNYPEEGFFKTPGELKKRALNIIYNKTLQIELREKGKENIQKRENTFIQRLEILAQSTRVNK